MNYMIKHKKTLLCISMSLILLLTGCHSREYYILKDHKHFTYQEAKQLFVDHHQMLTDFAQVMIGYAERKIEEDNVSYYGHLRYHFGVECGKTEDEKRLIENCMDLFGLRNNTDVLIDIHEACFVIEINLDIYDSEQFGFTEYEYVHFFDSVSQEMIDRERFELVNQKTIWGTYHMETGYQNWYVLYKSPEISWDLL